MPISGIIQAVRYLQDMTQQVKALWEVIHFLAPGYDPMHLFRIRPFRTLKPADENYHVAERRNGSCKLAVITGASSGIGKAFARYFAGQGYDLLITGRRKDIIDRVADEIRAEFCVGVEVILANLSVAEDVSLLQAAIGSKHNLAVLVNNAGYGNHVYFGEDTADQQLDMVKVHVNAPLILIHTVLPGMLARKEGVIINVSSLATYFPAPGSAMYAGTKSFLKDFTESLHLEVCRLGVRVQCLCPGLTYSDFHRSGIAVRNNLIRWMHPSDIVRSSMRSLRNGEVICIPGVQNRILAGMSFMIPRRLYYRFMMQMEKSVIPGKDKLRHIPVQPVM